MERLPQALILPELIVIKTCDFATLPRQTARAVPSVIQCQNATRLLDYVMSAGIEESGAPLQSGTHSSPGYGVRERSIASAPGDWERCGTEIAGTCGLTAYALGSQSKTAREQAGHAAVAAVRDDCGELVNTQIMSNADLPHGIGHCPHGAMSDSDAIHVEFSTTAGHHLDSQ